VRLDRLINELDVFERPVMERRLEIDDITDNLDAVHPGSLFGCVVGSRADGHDFAQQAIEKGAVALLVERELDVSVPQIRVPNVRAALAPAAAALWRHPDKHLRIIGITGTNGKTTTTQVLAEILRHHKWKTETIGTLSGKWTSPPAPVLQKMLATMRDERTHAVVMEVSSHAMMQHRVDNIRFRAAVFTNLTQDHLDYHKTMSAYFEAKAALFDPGRTERAIINVDDPYGRELIDRTAVQALPYGLGDAQGLEVGPTGSHFHWQGQDIYMPLVGTFNVYNALAAATTAHALGVAIPTIAEALATLEPVPGRLETIDRGQPFSVFVDFAHTPDGLQNVLLVARNVAEKRQGTVTVVFGCGGDRDTSKRPQMGALCEQLADKVIITSDNPRSEDPAAIVNDIVGGLTTPDSAVVEPDRAKAIDLAISAAKPGEVVLIAGKGHETTQEVNGVKQPFDDRVVASEAIERLRSRLQSGERGSAT